MELCSHFYMQIYQELLVVAIVALKSCPSSKLVLQKFVLDRKTDDLVRSQNLRKTIIRLFAFDRHCHLELGTPNIIPRSFIWTRLMIKTFLL